MKKTFLFSFIFCSFLSLNAQVKYEPTWESLKQYNVPEWWKNTKFGIYFHWGPYSVPAYKTEWYSHWMYEDGNPIRKYHETKYGPLWKFGYKDFIKDFKAEKFNADEWAALFKKAGAQFAGPVAEHADGFAMWDSKVTPWNSVKMGPKKDIVRLMQQAIKKQGMKFVVTYHRHWIYGWYPTWNKNTDAGDPKYAGLYGPKTKKGTFEMAKEAPNMTDDKFGADWLARLEELMDNYEPDIIWFDNRMNIVGEKYRKQFLADYYNKAQKWGKEVVCTYKAQDMAEGSAVLDLERSRMSDTKPFCWLTDDSVDWGAWCNVSDPNYKTTNRLIDFLVDVVSKNGAVLLNVTPTAEGVMPDGVVKRLTEMGEWLKLNGEAIYNTRPWVIYGEGPQKIVEGHLSEDKNDDAVAQDIRFTTCGNKLYATALDWPADGKITIHSLSSDNKYLKKKIKGVSMIGSKEKLRWSQTKDGLVVNFPKVRPCEHAFVMRIKY